MDSSRLAPSKRAGILLGIGLGGFVDGILLHQIIHWHNMGSARVPPTTMHALQQNMVWDGLFHVFLAVGGAGFILAGMTLARLGFARPRPS